MEVYRVSKRQYQQDLIGTGAYLAGGRWNTMGNYMLYTAASRSLAILEVLVHISRGRPIDDYAIIVVYVPDSLFVDSINLAVLPNNWKEEYSETQAIGNQWLRKQSSLSLKVPSALVKAEYNYLLNSGHEAFSSIKVLGYEPLRFDERFLIQ